MFEKWFHDGYITLAIALWGAIVATTMAVLNFKNARRDRGILRIKAAIMLTSPGNVRKLVVEIINAGRRPMTVKMLAGKYQKADEKGRTEIFFKTGDLPKLLTEGEQLHELMVFNPEFQDLSELFVVDSLGKKWYASKEDVLRVCAETKRMVDSDKSKSTP